jgi:hypothetical protein
MDWGQALLLRLLKGCINHSMKTKILSLIVLLFITIIPINEALAAPTVEELKVLESLKSAVPVLKVENNILRWSAIPGAKKYVITEIRGDKRSYRTVRNTSYDPTDRAGETVRYSIRIDPNNEKWAEEVTITYPDKNKNATLSVTVTAKPSTVRLDQSTTIEWSSTGATSCDTTSLGGKQRDEVKGSIIRKGNQLRAGAGSVDVLVTCSNISNQSKSGSTVVKVEPITAMGEEESKTSFSASIFQAANRLVEQFNK